MKQQKALIFCGSEIAVSGISQGALKRNFMCLSDRAEIVHDVLSYLAKNDEAGDTFEGIVEWWLLERNIRRGSTEVKAALDDLVARELIREYKTRDAKVHYRTNSRKQEEINALIENE